MQDGNTTHLPCAWCRKAVPAGAERCPHCGREPQPAGLIPLGGPPAALPEGPGPRAAEEPAPLIRDPLAELERRRTAKAARVAPYVRLTHSQYVRYVLREDQVFAFLVGLLAFQAILSLLFVLRHDPDSPFPASGLVWSGLRCLMVIGLLTFQRWAHTALVWAAGVTILWGAVAALGLLLAPLSGVSGLTLFVMWLQWVIGIAGGVFMLVVLSERSAYFEGIASRVKPRRTRLSDFLNPEYYRRANAPPEYGEPELPRPPAAASRTEPSSVVQPTQTDLSGLKPFPGGSDTPDNEAGHPGGLGASDPSDENCRSA